MDKAARRAAINAYKERPLDWGAYAVRCSVTCQVWVGASRRLSTQQNALWFQLRAGGCMTRTLQAAWSAAGAEAFSFEPLESLPADTPEFERARRLKDCAQTWREKLSALPI